VPCVASEKRDLSSWALATSAYLRLLLLARDGSLVLRRVASVLAWAGGAPSAPEAPTQLAKLMTGLAPVGTAKIPAELAVMDCVGAKQAGAVETARAQTALSTLDCKMAALAELLALAPVETAKIPEALSTLDCAAEQQVGLVETARVQTALSTLYCEMAELAELLARAPVETAKIPAELAMLN